MRTLALFAALSLMNPAPNLHGDAKSHVTRVSLAAMEKSFDNRLSRIWPDDPFLIIGMTRGVYVPGFGAVFSTEVNLVTAAGITPFHPAINKDDIAQAHQKKLDRLPQLKRAMREMLKDSAASLDTIPGDENIVVGVSIFRNSWENIVGIPSQIVMQGQKKVLLAAQAGRASVDAIVREQEY